MKRWKRGRLSLGLDERIDLEHFLAWVEGLTRRGKVRILTEMLAYERMRGIIAPWVSPGDFLPITQPEKGLVPEEVLSVMLTELIGTSERKRGRAALTSSESREWWIVDEGGKRRL